MKLWYQMLEALRHVKRCALDHQTYVLFKIRFLINAGGLFSEPLEGESLIEDEVTVVITSCGRSDLLKKMLYSFAGHNTFKVTRYIFVEDANDHDCLAVFRKFLSDFEFSGEEIVHELNQGQLASIDEAYSLVKTRYVMHLEDDWEFIQPGFIEESLASFTSISNLCSVSIKPHSSWGKVPIRADDAGFNYIAKPKNNVWDGISINPGVYDIQKWRSIGGYSQYKKERRVALAYRFLGYRAVLSSQVDGFVVHSGDGRSTRKNYRVA